MTVIFIIVFVIVLGIMVLAHEFGHFLAAKMLGVKVEEFAFGFKPTLFSWVRGETKYMFNAIPIGGFVKLKGEEGEEMMFSSDQEVKVSKKDPRSFAAQKPWRRAVIASAGVFANLILAWLLLTIWLIVTSYRPSPPAVFVASVIKDSSAHRADIKAGDILIAGNGQKISNTEELKSFTKANKGKEVTLTVRRFGKDQQKRIDLSQNEEAPLGVVIEDMAGTEKIPWYQAPYYALVIIGNIIAVVFVFLWELIKSLFGGAPVEAASEISGPIGIYGLLSQMVSIGFVHVLRFVAILSLSLSIFNILPIPALDGGRLLFIGLEGLFGKRVIKERMEAALHTIGFAILVALLLVVSYRDIVKLIRG